MNTEMGSCKKNLNEPSQVVASKILKTLKQRTNITESYIPNSINQMLAGNNCPSRMGASRETPYSQ